MNFGVHRARRRASEVNITPLIDIVFILLIFFLITATFVENPGIDVELPKAATAPSQSEGAKVILGITKEGRVIYGGKAISDQELENMLGEQHKKQPKALIIIQADTDTSHGKVVEVMDIARSAGFEQLAVATDAAP